MNIFDPLKKQTIVSFHLLLFQKDKLLWLPNIKKNSLIEVGQLLGNAII